MRPSLHWPLLLWELSLTTRRLSWYVERGKMFEPSQAGVVISTYSMISYSGQRNEDKQLNMDQIKRIDWGLLILDEV